MFGWNDWIENKFLYDVSFCLDVEYWEWERQVRNSGMKGESLIFYGSWRGVEVMMGKWVYLFNYKYININN